jgi:hypothetical protein
MLEKVTKTKTRGRSGGISGRGIGLGFKPSCNGPIIRKDKAV